MKYIFFLIILLASYSCNNNRSQNHDTLHTHSDHPNVEAVKWSIIDTINVEAINSDLNPEEPTVDVGIYFPSNLDAGFSRVRLEKMMEGFIAAKEIYSSTSVQFKLLWVKTGEVNPTYFSFSSSPIPEVPNSEHVNLYEDMKRNPDELTEKAEEAFESIIEPDPENGRTIYLVVLQDVFFPFYEQVEGERNWIIKWVRTSALSFPSYSYGDKLPDRLRGVITISNLTQEPAESRKVIAHEIGHKIINVSHEYQTITPEHEVFGEGGLMIYGSGLDIPSGKAGRYHLERLLLSPYIYKLDKNGKKVYNPSYKEGGHYYDPVYGDYVIHF